MGISNRDAFRVAVSAAAGLPAIHDIVWERVYDRELARRFRTAERKADRDAAVREQARYARQTYEEVVDAGAPRTPASERMPSDASTLPAASGQSEPLTVTLTEYEQNRTWAYSLEIAALAEALVSGGTIQRFRDDWLGGVPLSTTEAHAWLLSENARLNMFPTFCETTMTVAGGGLVTTTHEKLNPGRYRQQVKLPSGEVAEYAPQSPVAKLFGAGEFLCNGLPWTKDDAAWFILTGEPPPIQPLRGSFTRMRLSPRGEQHGVITIEVEPWVSEKSMGRLYSEVRGRVLLQHDPRPQGLTVWRFVESLHAATRPTLRDVWRSRRQLGARSFLDVWKRWRTAHPELRSLSITDACRQWNEKHADDPGKRYRYCGKFRAALLSGIEHGGTTCWPDYLMLADREPLR